MGVCSSAGSGAWVVYQNYAVTFHPLPIHPGLLRLEELVRQFLISKETLSIRMLDDTNDPTPLLKEIRDDKISTIIIDANASISYLILKKVRNGKSHTVKVPVGAGSTRGSSLAINLCCSFVCVPLLWLCLLCLSKFEKDCTVEEHVWAGGEWWV